VPTPAHAAMRENQSIDEPAGSRIPLDQVRSET